MDKLLSIGRFAKLCRLSIKALRHYDETKLLVPAHVDATGYRYYERGQVRQAIAIALLRSLEMPIPTIRAVLAASSDAAGDAQLVEALTLERTRIERALGRSRQALSCVERLLRERSLFAYDVSLREEPAQRRVGLRADIAPERHVEEGFRLFDQLRRAYATLTSSASTTPWQPRDVACLLPDGPDEDTMVLLLTSERPPACSDEAIQGAGLLVVDLPASTVAFTTHRGSYDDVGVAQHAVLAWIHEAGHELAGAPREVYVDDPEATPEDDVRTELVVPIRVHRGAR